nr:structural protein [Tolivirales sp. gcode 6]
MKNNNKKQNKNQNNMKGSSQAPKGAAMGYTNTYKAPSMVSEGTSIVVRHRELITELTASVSFEPGSSRINPGDSDVFPWLSGIAQRYEKYKFRKLKFTIVPQVPTTQAGSLGLYFDYDPTDQTAVTASSFFSNMNAVTKQIWMEASTTAVAQQSTLYVSELNDRVNENRKWYDYGRINYFLQSGTNANAYLFAEYEVELSKPSTSYEQNQVFEGFAYWNGSAIAPIPTGAPHLYKGVGIDATPGKITVPISGVYQVDVLANSNNTNAAILKVCGQLVTRNSLGVDSDSNPKVMHYRFILPLSRTVPFYSFEVSEGTIDCNAFPGDATSWLGIQLKLLAPINI